MSGSIAIMTQALADIRNIAPNTTDRIIEATTDTPVTAGDTLYVNTINGKVSSTNNFIGTAVKATIGSYSVNINKGYDSAGSVNINIAGNDFIMFRKYSQLDSYKINETSKTLTRVGNTTGGSGNKSIISKTIGGDVMISGTNATYSTFNTFLKCSSTSLGYTSTIEGTNNVSTTDYFVGNEIQGTAVMTNNRRMVLNNAYDANFVVDEYAHIHMFYGDAASTPSGYTILQSAGDVGPTGMHTVLPISIKISALNENVLVFTPEMGFKMFFSSSTDYANDLTDDLYTEFPEYKGFDYKYMFGPNARNYYVPEDQSYCSSLDRASGDFVKFDGTAFEVTRYTNAGNFITFPERFSLQQADANTYYMYTMEGAVHKFYRIDINEVGGTFLMTNVGESPMDLFNFTNMAERATLWLGLHIFADGSLMGVVQSDLTTMETCVIDSAFANTDNNVNAVKVDLVALNDAVAGSLVQCLSTNEVPKVANMNAGTLLGSTHVVTDTQYLIPIIAEGV